jgi:hypothetical protein
MNPRSAPCGPFKGFSGQRQSGNSRGWGYALEPAGSNADIWFICRPPWGQE